MSAVKRCAAVGALVAGALVANAGPSVAAPDQASTQVEAGYVVTLDASATGDVGAIAAAQLESLAGDERPLDTFRSALRGYVAELTAGEAQALAAEPGVAAVERDGVMWAFDTQANAPWGLDRIDQPALPLNSTYTYTQRGQGVTAYVIDTGIRFGHADFGGRATSGFDAIDGGTADDCNGHGTHVASTLGGSTYGVAKGVNLVGVRVLDCNGSGAYSSVIAGIDWAVQHHQAGTPAVANMSLGGSASTAVDAAINRLIADGVSVSVAAGNSSADACNTSPARTPGAITVAASTNADALASFSNRGSCVDVIAPGNGITAAWSTSNTATNTISGTSMASPHAAGVAAQLLQATPSATPSAIAGQLTSRATRDRISGTGQSCWFWIFCTPATPNVFLRSS